MPKPIPTFMFERQEPLPPPEPKWGRNWTALVVCATIMGVGLLALIAVVLWILSRV